MTCPRCKKTIPDGVSFCPSCGASVGAGSEGKAPDEVTREWLRDVLSGDGYDVKFSEKDPNAVHAKHRVRPNILITVRTNLSLITIQHWWGIKKPGWGGDARLRAALNDANARSWRDTFSLDKEGDLTVSAYIVLPHRLTDQDILGFLDKEAIGFVETLRASGLQEFVK